MNVGIGTAKGLEYLHCRADPPVIYRDSKSANILLDNDFHPKLSDFGLAKLGPVGHQTHVFTRVIGTFGYCALDYVMSGKLTFKSDVYGLDVVLLELVTGRKEYDLTKSEEEQSVVEWAWPLLKDRRKHFQLVDPVLKNHVPVQCLRKMIFVIAMCLPEEPSHRPPHP